jgi:tetratricopeptide (TPR) repeat protein
MKNVIPSRYAAWLIAAAGAVAIIVAFAPGLRTPFHYDDLSSVVENGSIRRLSAIGQVLSPPADGAPTAGRPVLNLTFAIDYALNGLDVVGYHVTNLSLHLICALLLFGLVRTTVRSCCEPPADPAARLEAKAHPTSLAAVVAAAAAAIWAVHPLQTGTVTYISGRSESLMAVCYLATLLAAIRAHGQSRRTAWTVLAVVACAIGMACKESMVTAPIAVVLYDRAYMHRRLSDAFRQRWRLYAGLAATGLVVGALALQAPRGESAGFATAISPWTYLVNQAAILPEYFRLAVWPDYVPFVFGDSRQVGLADVGLVAGVAPALLLIAMLLWYRSPALGFPALWIFLTLAPTSTIVPIATEAGAARRMYLPLAGIAVLVVLAIARLSETLGRRGFAAARTWAPAAIALPIVVILSARTGAQSAEFASAEQLWRSAIEHWPSALAHRNLAAVLLQQGRRMEAAEELRAASNLKPLARYSLGVELFEEGRASEAIGELQRAIQEFPDHPTIRLEGRRVLARALQQEGRQAEAADVYGEIAQMTPGDLTPMVSRADALLAAGNLPGAHQAYQAVLARRPQHAGALTNDGLTLLRMGRAADAIPLLQRASEQQPENAGAYMNLGSALAAAGHAAEAAAAVCHAIAVDPANQAPHQFLADLREAASAARIHLPPCNGGS